MGRNPNRIVTGVVRAKIVYLPQGSSCAYPNQHLVQVASLRYREYIDKKNYRYDTELNGDDSQSETTRAQ